MYQIFYVLTAVLLVFWIGALSIWSAEPWAHLFLAAAVVSMAIGLFRRSAGS